MNRWTNVNTFNFFQDHDNVRKVIKSTIVEKELGNRNIKEKNNFLVFNEMSAIEWQEVVEPELLNFLNQLK